MFASRHASTLTSAERLVEELMLTFPLTSSVVDIGCGVGTFLSVFKERAVHEVLGLDGPWVDQDLLQILPDEFQVLDLENPPTLIQKFDLAICLEVAEHISPAKAFDFITFLCGLSDVVVFSAAIPGQGGNGHVNEQWPSYWVEIFESCGYHTYDIVRPRIWDDESILYWYRQNTLIFSRNKLGEGMIKKGTKLNVVHPLCYEAKLPVKTNYLKRLCLAAIPNNQIRQVFQFITKRQK